MGNVLTIVCFVLSALGSAAAQEDPKEFFTTQVRPLLSGRCYNCHSGQAQKLESRFRLDSREGLLAGGERGAAMVPGNPQASRIISAVSWDNPDLRMPPDNQLPDGEIRILTTWVSLGAPWFDEGEAPPRARPEKEITAADRAFWSFVPMQAPELPELPDVSWCRNEIDRFVLEKLRRQELSPAPEASRAELIRRATFDLHGLPPTPEEVEAFVSDPAPDAYEKLIDRLLASPRTGERWARHWLDLVRYAESDGFKQDAYRPNVWPYRDYVIRALNDDKPYDRFVQEQLAGDELAPDDPSVLVATTFLRLGIYEYNQRNITRQREEYLDDLTDVTGDVFLGLGMGCARCHDHKFDPILQSDYYRLQSFFEALLPRDDLVLATPAEGAAAAEARRRWEEKTADVRRRIAALEEPYRERARNDILSKFLPEYLAIYRKPAGERTPLEHQIAYLVGRQVIAEEATIDGKIKGKDRETWSALRRELAALDAERPPALLPAFVATDVGPAAPPTIVPGKKSEIAPGIITVLGSDPLKIEPRADSTGRRTALARWLTRPDHPLTARVAVNRLWQQHFGRGLVATPSDFGRLGERPTHPELLDWLALRFVASGWSVKSMHRLMMTSAAYRQTSLRPATAEVRAKDPENRWLWRMNPRRLQAEEVRDAMLAASGELDLTMGGPAVDASAPRRGIYTRVSRNVPDPLLAAFDAADGFNSMPARNVTTTATQALLLINGAWTLSRAESFARRLGSAPRDAVVDRAYRIAFGRPPGDDERRAAMEFLRRSDRTASPADAPLTRTMPHRGGQALLVRGDHAEDRLRLPPDPSLPSGDFTVEAIVQLDSLYDTAEVRVIASRWNGSQDRPGWSFGVTSKKSMVQPQNLILQLVGDGGYEVVASDLRVELHKTYYVGAAARLAERSVTFWAWDLTDAEASLRSASVRTKVGGPIVSTAALVIGGRDGQASHGWDGLIDEVRLSEAALAPDQLLVHEGAAAGAAVGHWKFEETPGVTADSTGRRPPLKRAETPRAAGPDAALVDFCHTLLNADEFIYVD
jgi:hypothetical protein